MPTCKVTPTKYSTNGSWESPEEKPTEKTDALLVENSATGANLKIEANGKARSLEASSSAKGTLTQTVVKLEIGDKGGSPTANASNAALKFVSGLTYTPNTGAELLFVSSYTTTAQTITTAGKELPSVTFNGKGKWKLEDKLKCQALTVEQAGSLDTNGQEVSVAGTVAITSATLSPTTITLGASKIVCQGWAVNSTEGMTFTAGTSTLEHTLASGTFGGAALTYNVVTLAADAIKVKGANTFATLNVNNKGGATGIVLEKGVTQTVTTLATNGTEANPAKVISSEAGSAATIKLTGAQAVSYLKCKDIHVTSGSLTVNIPTGTKAEYDLGGNEGITFKEPAVSLTRSGSDEATVTDAAARAMGLPRASADSTTVTDAATRTTAHPRSAADEATLTDAATRTDGASRAGSDEATVSDAAASIAAGARMASDEAILGDSATTATSSTRSASDSTTIADSASVALSLIRGAADSTTVSDASTAHYASSRSAHDELIVEDTAEVSGANLRACHDSATVEDAATRTRVTLRASTDSATVTDSAQVVVSRTRSATDSAALTDAGVRSSMGQPRSALELIVITDAATDQFHPSPHYPTRITITDRPSARIVIRDRPSARIRIIGR